MSEQSPVDKVANLFERSGINPDDIESIERVNVWQAITKNSEGEAETHDLVGVQVKPKREEEELNTLSQAAPTIIRPTRARPKSRKDKICFDVPDLQFGFRRLGDGDYRPLHNEPSIDVMQQSIKELQPDKIIFGGDELDLPELSRYPEDSKHFIDTLQMSLDGLHRLLAQTRANAPNAEIRILSSNHIKRLGDFVLKNAMPLFGIRQANMPKDFPVTSFGHLLRLNELDIDFDGGYPAEVHHINDRLITFHGDKSNARGSTAAMYLGSYDTSIMFHHTHRQESLSRTSRNGQVRTAFSFGCLVDNTGVVPSYGNAVSDKGDVVYHVENWQNGFGYVEYNEGDRPFRAHPILLNKEDGYEAVINGKTLTPRSE